MTRATILTTGVNRGIGSSVVQALAQRSRNLTLIVVSHECSKAQAADAELGKQGIQAHLHSLELDVTDDSSI